MVRSCLCVGILWANMVSPGEIKLFCFQKQKCRICNISVAVLQSSSDSNNEDWQSAIETLITKFCQTLADQAQILLSAIFIYQWHWTRYSLQVKHNIWSPKSRSRPSLPPLLSISIYWQRGGEPGHRLHFRLKQLHQFYQSYPPTAKLEVDLTPKKVISAAVWIFQVQVVVQLLLQGFSVTTLVSSKQWIGLQNEIHFVTAFLGVQLSLYHVLLDRLWKLFMHY